MTRTGIRASAIITKENKILLMHRKKKGEEYWVFPGGGVEEGESSKQAVVREVREETGLEVNYCKLAFKNETFEGGNEHPFFACEVENSDPQLGGEEKEKNSDENWYQLEWVDIDKLDEINLVPKNAKEKFMKFFNKN